MTVMLDFEETLIIWEHNTNTMSLKIWVDLIILSIISDERDRLVFLTK